MSPQRQAHSIYIITGQPFDKNGERSAFITVGRETGARAHRMVAVSAFVSDLSCGVARGSFQCDARAGHRIAVFILDKTNNVDAAARFIGILILRRNQFPIFCAGRGIERVYLDAQFLRETRVNACAGNRFHIRLCAAAVWRWWRAFLSQRHNDPTRLSCGKRKMNRRTFKISIAADNAHKKIEPLRGRTVGDNELKFSARVGAAVRIVRVVVCEIRRLACRRRTRVNFYFFVGHGHAVCILNIQKQNAFVMRFDVAIFFDKIHARFS